MPFKSKAQQRKFFAMESRGEIPKGTAKKWADETKNISTLPERKTKKKKKNPLITMPGAMSRRIPRQRPISMGGGTQGVPQRYSSQVRGGGILAPGITRPTQRRRLNIRLGLGGRFDPVMTEVETTTKAKVSSSGKKKKMTTIY